MAIFFSWYNNVNQLVAIIKLSFIASGMGYKLANEKLKKNPNEKQFMEAYKNIDKYTEFVLRIMF